MEPQEKQGNFEHPSENYDGFANEPRSTPNRGKVDQFIGELENFSQKVDRIKVHAENDRAALAKMMLKSCGRIWDKLSYELKEVCELAGEREQEYYDRFDRVEERYYQALIEIGEPNEQNQRRNGIEVASLELEPLKIPKFHGTYESWPTFRSLFQTLIIDNASLSNIERMQYLRSVVTDEAEQAIESLPTTGDNFEKAWKILIERFDNKRLLLAMQINRLFELEQVQEHSNQLRKFYDESKECIVMLENVSSEQLLVNVLKNKLDDNTRELYEEQVEDNKIGDGLNDFFAFLNKRCRVLESVWKREKDVQDSAFCFNASVEAEEDMEDTSFNTWEAGEDVDESTENY